MTFSGYSFCGFTPLSVSIIPRAEQVGVLLDRWLLVQKTQVFDPFNPFFPAPTAIRPAVVPWVLASDRYGVAYPAGLLAVVDSIAQKTPAAGIFPVEWEEYWEYNISLAESNQHVVAVPQVLPVGYTARLKRDWHNGLPASSLTAGYTTGVVASGGYRVRTADGYNLYRWRPDPRIWGYAGTPLSQNVSPSVGFKSFQVYTAGPGVRKLQFQIAYVDRSGFPWVGSIPIKLSHDAAGPISSPTVDGTTVDFSASYSYANFSGAGVGTTYSTAWIDAGAISGTAQNTLTEFQSSMDLTAAIAGGLFSFGVVVSWRLSPRCDIPLPFTTTSQGDVIAPGGIAAGSIPGY